MGLWQPPRPTPPAWDYPCLARLQKQVGRLGTLCFAPYGARSPVATARPCPSSLLSSAIACVTVCVRVRPCVCVRVCAHVTCVRAHARVCAHWHVCPLACVPIGMCAH